MSTRYRTMFALVISAAVAVVAVTTASARPPTSVTTLHEAVLAAGSGALQYKGQSFNNLLKECPTAGEPADKNPKPLDLSSQDKVEQLSQGGDDIRVNQDYACFPQNETSIDVNPLNPKNVVAGQNDYRLGWGTSGFDASTDTGNHWYDGIIPFPTLPNDQLDFADTLDGGGDPAVVFDRAGVVYWVDINFNRTDDTNGIFAVRSYNGGFTWSRPCVPFRSSTTQPEPDRCGGPGDPRKPGDGVVTFIEDCNTTTSVTTAGTVHPFCSPTGDNIPNFSVPFNDKEYVAAGPRPFTPNPADGNARIAPQCFTPTHQPVTVCPASEIGVDRIYVTWTKFEVIANTATASARIYFSYSDDQGRSWSPEKAISGESQQNCEGFPVGFECNFNQFSTPTVHPTTGLLWVAFQNFNTQDENQYLVVRSRDGGTTFEGPFFVTFVFDVNYPRGNRGRMDCTARGQQSSRNVLTNSCFRVNSGGNIVVDRRGGEFADDLYLVMSDNRNGSPASSNVDVFLFKSVDGGTTWIGPTRVNDDPSTPAPNRDCTPGQQNCPVGNFGNDQWFPWVDISGKGDVNVVFHDRRLDTTSTLNEWPGSRQRTGNYLDWFWGAVCSVTTTPTVTAPLTDVPQGAKQCVAPEAQFIPGTQPEDDPGPGPQPGQSQTAFPFKNFTISDTPNNQDYSFRAGIFMGDYDNVAIGPDNTAYAIWTDSRNGRSSRLQAGRNPACEQADIFVDSYSAQSGGTAKTAPSKDVIDLFSVTLCPRQAIQGQ